MRVKVSAFLLTLAIASPNTAAAEDEASAVRIEQPWARASIGITRPAAAYLTIMNEGEKALEIIGFETPVARRVEPHRTISESGVMRMRPAGTLSIPAGDTLVLEPGGLHLMLMELLEPLEQGGSFPLTVRFDGGAPRTMTVSILSVGSRGPKASE